MMVVVSLISLEYFIVVIVTLSLKLMAHVLSLVSR